jgi:hypothetical protein
MQVGKEEASDSEIICPLKRILKFQLKNKPCRPGENFNLSLILV